MDNRRVAIIQTIFHEKESLVAGVSHQNGVVMHFMYSANELRDFEQIPKAQGQQLSKIDLTENLIEKIQPLSSSRRNFTTTIARGLLKKWTTIKGQKNTITEPVPGK